MSAFASGRCQIGAGRSKRPACGSLTGQRATNPWIVENRLEGQVAIYDATDGQPIDWPATTMFLVAVRV